MEKLKLPTQADKRRERAEKNNELSISHYRGDLHAHTKSGEEKHGDPERIFKERKGSNCGHIPLEILTRYHAESLLNEYQAITEHSRDASPDDSVKSITNWFSDLYLKKIGKTENELNTEEKEKFAYIKSLAVKTANYGDERIEDILESIDSLPEFSSHLKVIKGVEANLLPDGNFDTKMIDNNEFEIVNCSIHTKVGGEEMQEIIKDPKKYSNLAIKGINNPKTNIMCHIGYGCKGFNHKKFDWSRIAEEAIKNDVALEINLGILMKYIFKNILSDPAFAGKEKYEKFENELPRLIPILGSEEIRDKLKEYFAKGLKISINTDEHKNPFIDVDYENGQAVGKFKKRNLRFWRALKIVEKYFNKIFQELEIKKENIINTYSQEELQKFLEKK
ncbi:hypothetical protein KAU09_02965 [Candidatus Parcubacteria bacterium]|nr:hypothetical protein [Candidatus Parcubacteria bacterium]